MHNIKALKREPFVLSSEKESQVFLCFGIIIIIK